MRCGQITLPSPHSGSPPMPPSISNRSPIFRSGGGLGCVGGGEFTLCYFYGSFVRNWVATFEGSDLEMGSEKEYERF